MVSPVENRTLIRWQFFGDKVNLILTESKYDTKV